MAKSLAVDTFNSAMFLHADYILEIPVYVCRHTGLYFCVCSCVGRHLSLPMYQGTTQCHKQQCPTAKAAVIITADKLLCSRIAVHTRLQGRQPGFSTEVYSF